MDPPPDKSVQRPEQGFSVSGLVDVDNTLHQSTESILYLTPRRSFHRTIGKPLVDTLKDGPHNKERQGYGFTEFALREFATELPEIVEATEFGEAGSELLHKCCRRSGY